MNYLAHIYLSSHNDGLLAGNFIADAVKGRPEGRFPDEIVNGIIMHRAIDEYTDNHPAIKEFVSVFRPAYGRYAPVLTDVLFDYLLAGNWVNFSDTDLAHFADDIYLRLGSNRGHFPERMQQFYDHMVRYNFLVNYGTMDGISQTLNRLQMRAKSDIDFTESIALLENKKGRLSSLFEEFFMDMQQELIRRGYK